MTQTSAFHLAAESTQPQLHMLTLQALNMIPPASFAVPAASPQGIATTILSMVLKLVYKKMTEPKEVDVIGIIQETLMKNTSEWLESEYQAVRKDAESLQDAISSWQNSPTEEARQLIVDCHRKYEPLMHSQHQYRKKNRYCPAVRRVCPVLPALFLYTARYPGIRQELGLCL